MLAYREIRTRLLAATDHLRRRFALPPATTKNLLIAAALIYIILPNDLVPDWLGILGRLDDLLVLTYIVYRYRKLVQAINDATERVRPQKQKTERREEQQTQSSQNSTALDPFETLGLKRGASKDEVKEAYRRLVAQYHPDKVNHLGPELKDLAHKKMLEIQKAYEQVG